MSRHIFFSDRYFGYDDAIYTTLRVNELISRGINLNKEMQRLPKLCVTGEVKVEVMEENKFQITSQIKKVLKNTLLFFSNITEIIGIDGLRIQFEKEGGLVRVSHTTQLLSTRFEVKKKFLLDEYKNAIYSLINLAKGKL